MSKITEELRRSKIWQELLAEQAAAKNSTFDLPQLYKGRFSLVVNNGLTVYKRIPANGKA